MNFGTIGDLKIDCADCFVRTGSQETGIRMRGGTQLALNTLTRRTDRNYGGTIGDNHVSNNIAKTDAGSFSYNQLLGDQTVSATASLSTPVALRETLLRGFFTIAKKHCMSVDPSSLSHGSLNSLAPFPNSES
jgi:hypothetical protein